MDAAQHNITLYVVPNCPLCSEVRQWLDQRGTQYVERDVTADWGALRSMYQGTRQRLVPVLKVNETYLVRPSREELARLLN